MARRRKKTIEQLVGERLRAERDRQGLSQAELARRAGVSQSNIARLEDGSRSCTVSTLAKLAGGLKLGLGDLVAEVVDPPKPAEAEAAFYRLADKLRNRSADYLKAVDHLIRALDAVAAD